MPVCYWMTHASHAKQVDWLRFILQGSKKEITSYSTAQNTEENSQSLHLILEEVCENAIKKIFLLIMLSMSLPISPLVKTVIMLHSYLQHYRGWKDMHIACWNNSSILSVWPDDMIPTHTIVRSASTNYRCSSSSETLYKHLPMLIDKLIGFPTYTPGWVLKKVTRMKTPHNLLPMIIKERIAHSTAQVNNLR